MVDPIQKAKDEWAYKYDPRPDNYDLEKDPRCLWGWGPPGCDHKFGHGCFRALGHPGHCRDEVSTNEVCYDRRPNNWDSECRKITVDGPIKMAPIRRRRKCKVCLREYAVRVDGTLREHLEKGRVRDPYNPGPYCKGGGE